MANQLGHDPLSRGRRDGESQPWARATMAMFTPTTRPRESNSGPPELPGFNGAVCWTTFSISRPPSPRIARPTALTTPVETVEWNPNGLPMAITN